MSFLRVENLRIALGEFALKGVSLGIERGDYLTVMGPTGAGKTILLECIIGFYQPEQGRVFLDGRDITDDPPEKRGIGIVYQDYALMPHMTVFKNIEYGLKKVDADKERRKAKILNMAESLNIAHILHRKPTTLSGGEQQRTALARALVVEPRLLLMDEPLSALDPQTRHITRGLLRKAMGDLDITVLHITHDMDDVWALADKVAVMRNGKMAQHDTLDRVFNRPLSRFVADFVGASLYEGTVLPGSNGSSRVAVQGVELTCMDRAESGANVRIAMRPDKIVVHRERPGQDESRNLVKAVLEDYYQEGVLQHLFFRSGEMRIPAVVTANAFRELSLDRSEQAYLSVKNCDVKIV